MRLGSARCEPLGEVLAVTCGKQYTTSGIYLWRKTAPNKETLVKFRSRLAYSRLRLSLVGNLEYY